MADAADVVRFASTLERLCYLQQRVSQFVFSDFTAAIAFVVRLAFAAEAADHHPDIDVRWNKVTLGLTTHEAGALTAKDTALAAQLSSLTG